MQNISSFRSTPIGGGFGGGGSSAQFQSWLGAQKMSPYSPSGAARLDQLMGRPLSGPKFSKLPKVPYSPKVPQNLWRNLLSLGEELLDDLLDDKQLDPWAETSPIGYSFLASGWTKVSGCQACAGLQTCFNRIGLFSTDAVVCPGSQVGTANANLGDAIGGSIVRVNLTCHQPPLGVCSTTTLNGRVYEMWRKAGSPHVPVYHPDAVVTPLPDNQPRSWPDPEVEEEGQTVVVPEGDGKVVPSVDLVPETRAGGDRIVPRPGTHTKEPDGKTKVKLPYNLFLKVYHALTELGDGLDCLYEALPEMWRDASRYHGKVSGHGTTTEVTAPMKALRVYQHMGTIDWAKAAKCLVYNEIEDRIVGKAMGKLGDTVTKGPYGGPNTTQLTQYQRQLDMYMKSY